MRTLWTGDQVDFILDTYAWIEYTIGSNKGIIVKGLIDNQRNNFLTLECSIAELKEWCIKENKSFENILFVVRNYSSIVQIKLNNWIEAAIIKHEKRKIVKDFGLMDALLLAKQKELKCRIITGDKHFRNEKDVIFLE